MSKVLSDHFSIQNVNFRRFWRGYTKFGYVVFTSVERGHLADWYQNVSKDLNYSQHKFQEHH